MAKVGIVSLGCAKNLVDTEVMLGLLRDAGYEITSSEQEADVLIVNTCGFIESAKEESIMTILELAKNKEAGPGNCKGLVVTGCLSQRYASELKHEIPEIDAIIGTGDIHRIVDAVKQVMTHQSYHSVTDPDFLYDHQMPRVLSTPRHTAYLKIAEGCSNCCSYCVIPYVRGNFRSREMTSIISEARNLVSRGTKELILIAQDTTRYGLDRYGKLKLAELLEQLAEIENLHWIRIMYCYPAHFTPDLIDAIAKIDKVCKYVDLPLQHADPDILQQMRRKGSIDDIRQLIADLRQAVPDITLRTSFIVGFPGEQEHHFNNMLKFIEEIRFDRVGVFTYSQEEGTPAAALPDQVSEQVKQERFNQAMKLQQQISLQKNKDLINKQIEVVIEGKSPHQTEFYIGRSHRDAPEIDGLVYVKGTHLRAGNFYQVRITKATSYDLIGEVIK